jgi:hypothetical protein
MDIGNSVGCAGSRVGLGVIVGVTVFEGDGEALGVDVDVDVDVDVGVNVAVEDGVGLIEAVCVKLGLRVEASLGVIEGCGDAAPAGCDAGGVTVTEATSCPQALKNKPRTMKAKAALYILRMGNPPRKMPDCTA